MLCIVNMLFVFAQEDMMVPSIAWTEQINKDVLGGGMTKQRIILFSYNRT